MDVSSIDQLFVEKFLSQTKKLANGKEIKIFSRRSRESGGFIYSCHLCGFIDIGDEQALHLHVMDKMHRSLLELKLLPMRSWMKEVVIEKKPCSLGCGDCSHLKTLLENMCGMTSAQQKTNDRQTSGVASVGRVETKATNLKRSSSSSGGSLKEKRRRRRSPKERRSRSRSKRPSKRRHREKQGREKSRSRETFSDSDSGQVRIKRKKISEPRQRVDLADPPPTFLSICRLLVTLEQHITKYSNDIQRMFSLSLSFERQKIGSSNELLTMDNLNFLAQLKHHLKDQIVEGGLPLQMLGVARSFVNDFDRLVNEKFPKDSEKKDEVLIDIEMPQI